MTLLCFSHVNDDVHGLASIRLDCVIGDCEQFSRKPDFVT